MATGLYSGVSGLAIGVGLNKGVTGLWSGASGLIAGWGGGFNPLSLFAAGEPGAWYDPSDLSTMFQDTAGTTPVTATGQTVGLLLDKSKGLVLGPEKVSNGTFDGNSTAGWVAGFGLVNGTFIASGGVATLTQGSSDTAPRFVTTLSGLTVGASYRLDFTSAAQSGSGDKYVVWTSSAAGTGGNTLNQDSGGGWAGQSRSFLVTATATTMYVAVGLVSGTTGSSVSIDNISVKELPGNHATQATAASRPQYQVDGNGKAYLLFDGTDDFLLTGTITPGIDKAQVFAGVRKLSDAATGMLAEWSGSFGNPGTFAINAPEGAANNYRFISGGSLAGSAIIATSGYVAPISNVLALIADISGDSAIARINGAQQGQSTADQGTGNYTARQLYIGRRGGSAFAFNGRIYGLAVRFGVNLSAAQISQMETWMAGKTGVTI